MKLLIDTKARRVLFAEANKDVVDFLFSLLALPVGTAVSLLGMESMVGSAGHLYASAAKLDAAYVLPGADMDALLRPAVSSPAAASNTSLLRLPLPDTSAAAPSQRFFCQNHSLMGYGRGYNYVTDASGGKCPWPATRSPRPPSPAPATSPAPSFFSHGRINKQELHQFWIVTNAHLCSAVL